MAFTVRDLIEGRLAPVCVRSTDSVQTALNKMIENDFSQLPVVDGEHKPIGLVTSDSILRAVSHFGTTVETLTVIDTMNKPVTRHDEDDLFETLDALRDTCAVLILNAENKLAGIVTSYDATEYFRRRAEDMMLVEDIETGIKEHIEAAFTDPVSGELDTGSLGAAVQATTDRTRDLRRQFKRAVCKYLELQGTEKPKLDAGKAEAALSHALPKPSAKALDELTFNDYMELLLHSRSSAYHTRVFGLQANAVRTLLENVRNTRNDLAHFRGEISAQQRDQLHFCATWLERHPIGILVDWPSSQDIESSYVVRESAVTYAQGADDSATISPTDEAFDSQDSRYAPLAIWLQRVPPSQDRVTLSFEQVETIIGGELPSSARRHNAWWANDSVGHSWSREWLEAGWRKAQISMSEERVTFARIKARERAYIDFFGALQAELRKHPDVPLRETSLDGHSWLVVTSLPRDRARSLHFNVSFAHRARIRVELYIDANDQATNKRVYDALYADHVRLESKMDADLSWERLDGKRASRIAVYHPGSITDDAETLTQVRAWALEMMPRFYEAFAEPAERALSEAEKSGDEEGQEAAS